jgi:hypothetical protein
VRITIATSFGPTRLDVQRRAVDSWREAGFEVIALNSQAEIAKFEGRFADVPNVVPPRDARAFMKRPYVFVRDVVSALVDTGSPVIGIVNSDVEFNAASGFAEFVRSCTANSMLFGSRVDYAAGQRKATGVRYEWGYDFFFFDARLSTSIPDDPFCLGLPWWDFWFPLQFQLAGARTALLESPVAFHEAHPANYPRNVWLAYAGLMEPHLAKLRASPKLLPRSRDAVEDIQQRWNRLAIQLVEKIRSNSKRVEFI